MEISKTLLKDFAKAVNKKSQNGETKNTSNAVYGTTVVSDGKNYVMIDGSSTLTPVETTADFKSGERVTVIITNHVATVTGNLSSPAARLKDLLEVEEGMDVLETDYLVVNEALMAHEAAIDDLTAYNVTVEGKLSAIDAEIENLEVGNFTAEDAEILRLTAEQAEINKASIGELQADLGEFNTLVTNKFTAVNADIKKLDAEKLAATEAELKYANIDFTNIGEAAIKNFFAESGLIKNVTVGDQTITGELVGVTIKGDLIEGGTIVADKLVIKGEDGLYYKLNTDGETVESEQTEYNSLDGKHILAKSITATKISVSDLVAFDATIGGFNITTNSIYSGVKKSVNNTTRGIYLDNDGQVAFGDSRQYIKYYKDQNGDYRLSIAAKSIILGSAGNTLEETINEMQAQIDDIEIGGRNLIRSSTNLLFTDYQFKEIETISVTYDEDGNVTLVYSPLSVTYDDEGNATLHGVGVAYDKDGNVTLTE